MGQEYTFLDEDGLKYYNDKLQDGITSTYIKNLSVSGKTITYTRGNDTTGTITTQDTTYSAAGTSLGLVKSGGDVTISGGVITVTDNSHAHTIANVTGLQTALDAKQSSITGGASTIVSSNLTASRVLISNSSGKVAVSDVTSTELSYLDGTTSNIQAQLDGKASNSHGTHVTFSTTAPTMNGTASVGAASTVSRSDHVHPTDTSRAPVSHNHAASNITSGTLSSDRLPTVPIAKGGTGATTAAAVLSNLGLSATATEINILDGVTATTKELNLLDGVTATTEELNYVDGVTSNIQTQLDSKSPTSHTHNYAGSSSAGGAATSANKLNTNAGDSSTPVYFTNGVPTVCTSLDLNTTGSAAKLTTARTIQTNLGSTSSASFNGTANITPGVSGTLAIGNGGTGATTAANALKNLGLTATATELNYCDGVTENVQTQLDTIKGTYLPLSGGTLIGDVEAKKSGTGGVFIKTTNDNGTVGIYTATNRGLYDFTNSEWMIYKGSTTNNVTTVNGNCTGNAGTATKLATARKISLGGNLTGSASFNGTADITISGKNYYCVVSSNNQANYPWHRIAYKSKITGSSNDTDAILSIREKFSGGKYGILKVSIRTNSSGTASTATAKWIIRSGYSIDQVKIGLNDVYGETYADLFLKVGTYARTEVTQIEGDRVWTLVTSNEVTDTTATNALTSTECYATVEAAATALHSVAYTDIITSSDSATVNYANALSTARTIDGVSFNGTAAITHYGTCSTAAATVAKTVSLTSFSLVTGARVFVKFTVTNTASSPTLNVNSTGAKAIMYRGSAISAGYLAANRVYEFVYDGTDWEFIGDINTDTKNTTGSTDSSSKLFLIGATSQAANPQTYSHDTAYVGTDGCLYSNSTKVSIEGHTHSYAGSSSAGGSATSADKVNTNLIIKLNGGTTEGTNLFTFNGSAVKTVNITASSIGASASGHTHSYLPLSGGTLTGALTVNSKITASGEIISTSTNAFRAAHGNYGFFIRNDGTSTWFMLTANGDAYGGHNDLRPIQISNSSGVVTINKQTKIDSTGVVVTRTTSDESRVAVTNSLRSGHLTVSGAGKFGLYDLTNVAWVLMSDTNRKIWINGSNMSVATDGTIASNSFVSASGGFKSGSTAYGSTSVELYGNNPFIDFHADSSTVDYTSRIIEYGSSSSPHLSLNSTRVSLFCSSYGLTFGEGFSSGNYIFAPVAKNMTQPTASDSKVHCGASASRWIRVYSTNGVQTTSDERDKNIIGEIPQTYKDIFMELKPILYSWKDLEEDVIHMGLGAQTVEQTLISHGLSIKEFGAVQHDYWDNSIIKSENNRTDRYGMNYAELAVLTIPVVQDHDKEIKALKEENKTLRDELALIKETLGIA